MLCNSYIPAVDMFYYDQFNISKFICEKVYPFRGVISSPNFISLNAVLLDTVSLIIKAKNASDNFILFIPDKMLSSS